PRYVLPIIPLLGVPMMFAVRAGKPLFVLLAALSMTINFIATAVGPMPPDNVNDPLRRWYLPIFKTGYLSGEKVGKVAVQPEAGNLGESLFGKSSRSSIAPVVVWLLGGSVLLYLRAKRSDYTSIPYNPCPGH